MCLAYYGMCLHYRGSDGCLLLPLGDVSVNDLNRSRQFTVAYGRVGSPRGKALPFPVEVSRQV